MLRKRNWKKLNKQKKLFLKNKNLLKTSEIIPNNKYKWIKTFS